MTDPYDLTSRERRLAYSLKLKMAVTFLCYLTLMSGVYFGLRWLTDLGISVYPEHKALVSLANDAVLLLSISLIMFVSLRYWQARFLAAEVREVRQKDQLHALDQFKESVIDNALIWINVLDTQGRITIWNKAAEQISGYTKEEVKGNPAIWQWLYPDTTYRASIERKVAEILQQGIEVVGFETSIRTKSGAIKVIAWNSRRFFNENGTLMGSIAIGQDITAQKQLEEELHQLATHDFLTGLLNRRELMRRLEDDFARAARYQHPLSLLMIDIDHFKHINDQHGHLIGDHALTRFGGILQRAIRRVDYAGRYGGEEFVLVLPDTRLEMAVEMAEQLRQAVESEDWTMTSSKLDILTISIGVAAYEEACLSLDHLLDDADQALYRAKANGRNQICVVPPSTTGASDRNS